MNLVKALELRIPPLLLTAFFGIGMALVSRALPSLRADIPAGSPVSIFLAAAGALLAVVAWMQFRRAQTTVDPRFPSRTARLVTGGVYRFTRNPMYLGFALALGGWTLWLAHPLSAIGLPLYVAYLDRFQIDPEERSLQQKFAEEFRAYEACVRRWI